MKTLSKNITRNFFKTEEGFSQLESEWKKKGRSSSELLLYMIIRGKNWKKAFTPITNNNKLNNGLDAHKGSKYAFYTLCTILYPMRKVVNGSRLQTKEEFLEYRKTLIKERLSCFSSILSDDFLTHLEKYIDINDINACYRILSTEEDPYVD